MKKLQADVAAFHEKYGQPVMAAPRSVPAEYVMFRSCLLREELNELEAAMILQNITEVADGVIDLIYVAIGTACVFGINLAPIWEEVQKTNMAKTRVGDKPMTMKPFKPFDWTPPAIAELIEKQKKDGIALSELLKGKD